MCNLHHCVVHFHPETALPRRGSNKCKANVFVLKIKRQINKLLFLRTFAEFCANFGVHLLIIIAIMIGLI